MSPMFRWPGDPPGPPRHSRPYAGGQGVGGPVATAARRPCPVKGSFGGGHVGPGAAPIATRPPGPKKGVVRPGGTQAGQPATLPPDPISQSAIKAAEGTRDVTFAGLTGSRSRGLLEYGFNETGYTPGGAEGKLTFDPNNAFSKAALLKKNYDITRRGTGQQMGAAGQLYSGAYGKAQDVINRNQMQSEDTLQKNLIKFLADNSQQYARAGADFTSSASQAEADRMSRAPTTATVGAQPEPMSAAKRRKAARRFQKKRKKNKRR